MSIDPVGPLPDGSSTSTYTYPTEKADPRSSSFAVAIEQLGPGTTDVASVTVSIVYAVLR
jgi:hypothetical protein